jgi:hypothetical protein
MTRDQFDRYCEEARGTNPFVKPHKGGLLWSRLTEYFHHHLFWCPHAARPVCVKVHFKTKAPLCGRTYGFEAVMLFDGTLYHSALDRLGLEVLLP